ncbi:MAG: tetratricopeptide repeat protein [Acidobacteriota bacterium]
MTSAPQRKRNKKWIIAALVAVILFLGDVAVEALGETRKAIEFYERRIEIAREIGDRRGEGNALWNMSLSFDKLGERARAIEYAEAALRIFEEIESPHAEKVRNQLAEWRGESQQ